MHSQLSYYRWVSKTLPLLLFTSFLLWSCSATTETDLQQLFKENFSPAKNNLVKTDTGMAAQRLREQAFRLYDEQRYDQALILFDELRKGQEDPGLLFFTGNTLLVLGQYQNAQRTFQEVPEEHPRFLSSQWYAGLASLQLGQSEQAQLHLKRVADSTSGNYRNKARQLLRLLE